MDVNIVAMKCSNIKSRLLKKALQSHERHKVAAIGLSNKGTPIASAFNRSRFIHKGGGIHAEMAIMLMAPKCLKTIIIARVNKRGEFLPIDPCKACASKAKKLGIKITSFGA